MIDRNELVIDQAVTGGSLSYSTRVPHNLNISVSIKYTAGAAGSTKIQVSNTGDGTDWQDYPDSLMTLSGSGGSFHYSMADYDFEYINIICTASSGTTNFQARLVCKRDSVLG